MRLRSCLLFVKDVKASRDFYAGLLEVEPVEEVEGFVSFKMGETFLNLHRADDLSPLSTGGCVCYFAVEELGIWIEKVRRLGGVVWRGPLDTGTGWWIVQMKDPLGNVIGFESTSKSPLG